MGVQFTQVSTGGRGKRGVLRDVTFEAASGIVAVLGGPGSGKSELLALIAAGDKPASGAVLVDGCDSRKQASQVRRRVGYLPQEGDVLPDLTVYEMLDYLALLSNLEQPAARQLRISRTLERFDLGNHRDRRIRTLPAGVRRLVALAQACLGQVTTLLLDSPTQNLSAHDAWLVRTTIAALAREYLVFLATPSAEEAQAIAERVLILEGGRVVADAPVAELLARVEGQVWSMEYDGPPPLRPAGMVPCGLVRDGARSRLRGLATACPQPGAVRVPPCLEDAYVWILARDAGAFASPGEAPPPADPVGTAERAS